MRGLNVGLVSGCYFPKESLSNFGPSVGQIFAPLGLLDNESILRFENLFFELGAVWEG